MILGFHLIVVKGRGSDLGLTWPEFSAILGGVPVIVNLKSNFLVSNWSFFKFDNHEAGAMFNRYVLLLSTFASTEV